MNPSEKASREYLKNAVMTATPEQLQLMLFDGAIRFTLRGREALERDDVEGAFNGFERAQRIVLELNSGLRREVNPQLVDQTAALYDFIYRPGAGTTVILKSKEMGTISGLAFKKALLGIWLGTKPADKGLKKGMLGQ